MTIDPATYPRNWRQSDRVAATVVGVLPAWVSRIGFPAMRHRYSAIFALTLTVLLFVICAPDAGWARAVAFVLQTVSLVCAVLVAGLSPGTRDVAAAFSGLALVLTTIAAVTVGVPEPVAVLVSAIFAGLTTMALVVGVSRSIRAHGVTHQEVLGAIAVYLMLGAFFSFVIATIAALDPAAFFAGGSDGAPSEHVYFSFTVLTTTGFGDIAAASGSGRAAAVLEMLAGQIYMVTVISVLVSQLRGRLS